MVTNEEFEACERLAALAVTGDDAALRELLERLWPLWIDLVKASRTLAALQYSEDDVDEIVGRLVLKFSRPKGYGLRTYGSWKQKNPQKTFEDWLRIVTTNAARDYVRERLGPKPETGGVPSIKRFLNEFSTANGLEQLEVRPPFTLAQTARELVEFAREQLPEPQLRALSAWLEGNELSDIDQVLGLSTGMGAKLVRAAVATLRRRFNPKKRTIDDDGA